MIDAVGELVYVGKAKNLRARLLTYFRPRSRDPKAGRIVHQARMLIWEPATSEFAALLRELELIRRWQPRFNVQGQPRRRRRCYVCLGRRPAAYAFLSTRPSGRGLYCFGPVPASHRAREAVRHINDLFRLRDCPQAQEMVFADQRELFPLLRAAGCIRYEIRTCLGPCAAACSQAEYSAQVQAARAFLEGRDTRLLSRFQREMEQASHELAFERAAALRDKLDVMSWLVDRLTFMRRARARHSFIYPVQGHEGGVVWYLIHQGQVRAAIPAPRDDASKVQAAALIESIYRRRGGLGLWPGEEIDGVLLVAGWFKRHPEERAKAFKPSYLVSRRVPKLARSDAQDNETLTPLGNPIIAPPHAEARTGFRATRTACKETQGCQVNDGCDGQ
jgi:excinuclease ABC subunit C